LRIALTAKLEAANKALAEERASWEVADQVLRAAHESNSTLTRDLQVVRASTATLKEDLEAARASTTDTNQELPSKSAAFDELAVQERDAQNKLQVIGDEKKTQEQSTRKMLSKQEYSSLAMISSIVAHVVVLLKSYTPDLDTELLRRNYPFDDDDKRDALIDSVYDTAQHFVSQYEFSVVHD
jgi:chromosome segregation ATPase